MQENLLKRSEKEELVHFFQKNSARAPISSSTLGWDCLLTSQYEEKPCQAGDSSRAGRKAEPKPAEVETAGLREFVSSCIIVRFFFSVPHKTNIDSEKPSRERHRRRGAQANREIGLCSTAGRRFQTKVYLYATIWSRPSYWTQSFFLSPVEWLWERQDNGFR